uniref:Uncharacterized protein n=1 Tax=Nelumbo nucifera TaxID=4432 RepID=A0A822XPF3_NELNU|nr:TPA_asm: hypothetical protein HUJ06_023026 [Nelumbo nucifera]
MKNIKDSTSGQGRKGKLAKYESSPDKVTMLEDFIVSFFFPLTTIASCIVYMKTHKLDR